MVELVLTLPILVLLGMGVAEFGRLYFTAITVTNAARAGAQYGSQSTQASRRHGRDSSGALVAYRVKPKNNTDLTFTGLSGGAEFFALTRPSLVE